MRNYFEFENAAKINCGAEAAQTLEPELARFGVKKPLVICSIDAVRTGAMMRALSSLKGGKKGSAVCFDGVPNTLKIEIVREMKALFEKESCDAIVAIGGVSVLESAKALKMFLSQKCDDFSEIAGLHRDLGCALPMIFLPTEICFGVELNGFLTEGDLYLSSPEMVPNVLILDREIADKKPLRALAEGAVFAFGNAIEAYIGSEEDDPVEIYAEKAIRLLIKHAKKACERAGRKEAALGVALASALSGVAYGNVPYGAAHALAEAISESSDLSAESAMGLILAASLEKADDKKKERAIALIGSLPFESKESPNGSEVLIENDTKTEPNSDSAEMGETIEISEEIAEYQKATPKKSGVLSLLEAWIGDLYETVGVNTRISQTNLQRESFGAIAELAQTKRASVTAAHSFTKDEFIEILNLAY